MYNLNFSIIVVTYNCAGYIERFINDLTASLEAYKNIEILINDNDSTDLTYEICKKYESGSVKVSKTENIGFAKANNILIKQALFENVLLLNPDVFGFTQDFWKGLMQHWDKINPYMVKLLNPDLSLQTSVGDEMSVKRLLKRLLGNYKNPSESTDITYVESGIMAFLLVNKDILNIVGLLSEDFHMYGEDHDWFIRARKKGYKVQFDPLISLVHLGGASAKSRWSKKSELLVKLNSEKILIKKHYGFPEKQILLLKNNLQTLLLKR